MQRTVVRIKQNNTCSTIQAVKCKQTLEIMKSHGMVSRCDIGMLNG